MRIALTVAGSDSGGGAGIQADLKTFQRFGVFGTSVVTAVTAQNTRGVHSWEAVSNTLITAQLDSVAADLRPHAVKSGMLGNSAVIGAVADGLRNHRLAPYVLDPVMVATSGDPLLEPDAVDAIRSMLLPMCAIVTPNLPEAALLTGSQVRSVEQMRDAARLLVHAHGAGAALIKGGHMDGDALVDVLYSEGEFMEVSSQRIASRNTHGTGCTLSAAIAAGLALGQPLASAVAAALDYVHRAIASAPGLGSGHGPLNHMV